MAKFITKGVTFTHRNDYTGDVEISVEGESEKFNAVPIEIPFAALKAFIADAVRKQIIEDVTQQDDDEILGVDQLGDEPDE